jgi:hypothetical protein
VRKAVSISLPHDAEKGVIPIPPARNTAGLTGFLCSVKEPSAEPIFTSVASGTFFSERLKAVSRIRVVKTNSFSNGGLAMEKVRVLPSASVSGGSVSVTSANCPGLKLTRWLRSPEACKELPTSRVARDSGGTGSRNYGLLHYTDFPVLILGAHLDYILIADNN